MRPASQNRSEDASPDRSGRTVYASDSRAGVAGGCRAPTHRGEFLPDPRHRRLPGPPWAISVWFAHAAVDADESVWVSRPGARHSQNIASRPAVAIAIFDSTVPVGGAAAVYVEAVAG